MPELPEVEAVCRKLLRDACGARITDAKVYRARMTAPQAPLQIRRTTRHQQITGIERRGKHILLHLEGGIFLRVHLRMTGNLVVIPDARMLPVAARAWFSFEDGRALVLDDPRALGRITVHRSQERESLFRDLGPEPFGGDFTQDYFVKAARSSRKPAKLFLMDQKAVAGLGNIYAAEALHQAGIHPARVMSGIRKDRVLRLREAILEVLEQAVQSAIMEYDLPGSFQEGELFSVAVYGREGLDCPKCGASVRRIPQGGRSTYFCPRCQR